MTTEIIPYRGFLITLTWYDGYAAIVHDDVGAQIFNSTGPDRDAALQKAKAMIDASVGDTGRRLFTC